MSTNLQCNLAARVTALPLIDHLVMTNIAMEAMALIEIDVLPTK